MEEKAIPPERSNLPILKTSFAEMSAAVECVLMLAAAGRGLRPMYVYIMTNANRNVLYTGVTNNLARRIGDHRSGTAKGFTGRYNVTDLVYYEYHDSPEAAILREKQIKAGSRAKKISLIDGMNPGWRDLFSDLAED